MTGPKTKEDDALIIDMEWGDERTESSTGATTRFDNAAIRVFLEKDNLKKSPVLAIIIAGNFLDEAKEIAKGYADFDVINLKTATECIKKMGEFEEVASKLKPVVEKIEMLRSVLLDLQKENISTEIGEMTEEVFESSMLFAESISNILLDVNIAVETVKRIYTSVADKINDASRLADDKAMSLEIAAIAKGVIDDSPSTQRAGFLSAPPSTDDITTMPAPAIPADRSNSITARPGAKPSGETIAVVGFETPEKREEQIDDLIKSDPQLKNALSVFTDYQFDICTLVTNAYVRSKPLNNENLKYAVLGFLHVFGRMLCISIKSPNTRHASLNKLVQQALLLAKIRNINLDEFGSKILDLNMTLKAYNDDKLANIIDSWGYVISPV